MESTGYEFSVLFINLYLYSLCRYIRMGIESLVGDTYNTQFKMEDINYGICNF